MPKRKTPFRNINRSDNMNFILFMFAFIYTLHHLLFFSLTHKHRVRVNLNIRRGCADNVHRSPSRKTIFHSVRLFLLFFSSAILPLPSIVFVPTDGGQFSVLFFFYSSSSVSSLVIAVPRCSFTFCLRTSAPASTLDARLIFIFASRFFFCSSAARPLLVFVL